MYDNNEESMEEHKPKMAVLKELITKMYELIAKDGMDEEKPEIGKEVAEGEEMEAPEIEIEEGKPEGDMPEELMSSVKDFMRGNKKPVAGKSMMIAAKLQAKGKPKSKMRF